MNVFDALFVINQDSDLERLRITARRRNIRSALVLTTHHLFPEERRSCSRIAGTVKVHAFADLLADAEMQLCDDQTTSELARFHGQGGRSRDYLMRFSDRSLRQKNQLVHRKLANDNHWKETFFQPGLGVHSSFWRKQGGRFLSGAQESCHYTVSPIFHRPSRALRRPRVVYRVIEGGRSFLIFMGLTRIPLEDGVVPESIVIPRLPWVLFANFRKPQSLIRHLKSALWPETIPVVVTSVRDYIAGLPALGWPLLILQDGYLPPNLPRGYLDRYPPCRFVALDPISKRWFAAHRRSVVPPPAFLRVTEMASCSPPRGGIQRVILALNRAGDWSALVNRSDTDRLLECFCRLAERWPEHAFTVRPHPEMARNMFDGDHSLQRLERFVSRQRSGNLSVSMAPLESDLRRGDLFISEYSMVLIEALRRGRLGIIANLTSRRSFMQDYGDLGFATARGEQELEDELARHLSDPEGAALQQSKATDRYNDLVRALRRGDNISTECPGET